MIEIKFTDGKQPLTVEGETIAEVVQRAVKDHTDLGDADLRGADLSDADLRGADLSDADLRGANLSCADLSGADLSDADLRGANLSGADLSGANLICADLSDADLSGANLRGANLRGANLDFSCWPLWCGSLDVKINKRIFCQLLYHALRAGQSVDDPDVAALLNDDKVLALANRFHRVGECGAIINRKA